MFIIEVRFCQAVLVYPLIFRRNSWNVILLRVIYALLQPLNLLPCCSFSLNAAEFTGGWVSI
jgi:hypothetical protein